MNLCSAYSNARIVRNASSVSRTVLLSSSLTPANLISNAIQPRLSPGNRFAIVKSLTFRKNFTAQRCNARSLSGTKTKAGKSGEGQVSSYQPLQFGDQTAERSTITKSVAMHRYLLNEEALSRIKPFRPAWRSADGEAQYLLQDIERACLRRYGNQRLFRKEQLRRINAAAPADGDGAGEDAGGGDAAKLRGLLRKNKLELLARRLAHRLGLGPAGGGAKAAAGEEEAQATTGSKAVYTAIGTNFVMVCAKSAAFFVTGSASVLSEVVHSVADLGNQCLLAVGIAYSERTPDASHPYGYATERYVWSLISGVGIFFLGCGVSVYHGFHGLLHPEPVEHMMVGLAVLGFGFLVEGYSLSVALSECRHEAKKQQMSLREYLTSGMDPMNVSVLMEDSVAVLGVGVATSCLLLSRIEGLAFMDSVGSIVNGLFMGVVAVFLIQKNRELLVGQAVKEQRLSRVIELLEECPVVMSVHDVKAVVMGPGNGRFKAEINIDREALAQRCVERFKLSGAESPLLRAIRTAGAGVAPGARPADAADAAAALAAAEAGLAGEMSERLMEALGDELDRLEALIRTELPEVRHVDLEIL